MFRVPRWCSQLWRSRLTFALVLATIFTSASFATVTLRAAERGRGQSLAPNAPTPARRWKRVWFCARCFCGDVLISPSSPPAFAPPLTSFLVAKLPRRRSFRIRIENQISTWLSHDACLGVKWKVMRWSGWRRKASRQGAQPRRRGRERENPVCAG